VPERRPDWRLPGRPLLVRGQPCLTPRRGCARARLQPIATEPSTVGAVRRLDSTCRKSSVRVPRRRPACAT
jgi:hypothetical protein